MKCQVCNRDAARNGHCERHARAYENVFEKYEEWKDALKITWKEYLRQIVNNSLTGEWVREVAEYLINKGEE